MKLELEGKGVKEAYRTASLGGRLDLLLALRFGIRIDIGQGGSLHVSLRLFNRQFLHKN
jgi:hypothetical protein